MKKNLFLGLGLVGTMALALAGCGSNKAARVSFEEAYDASILSGISLLNSDVSNAKLMSARSQLMSYAEDDDKDNKKEEVKNNLSLTDSMKKDIIDNLAIARATLNGSSKKSDPVASDKSEWEMMYTITQDGINGEDLVYTFYYTETLDNEDKDEDEQEHDIKGKVIFGDMEYDVSGKREIEGDEEEVEYKVIIDAKNYVIIESEAEGNENEYEYSKYVDGKMVFNREVEYEINKNGEVEIEFEMTDENNQELEISYEFYKKDNIDYIKVEIESGKKESEALIKVTLDENNNPIYEFIE